jgi:hypothetical protein
MVLYWTNVFVSIGRATCAAMANLKRVNPFTNDY